MKAESSWPPIQYVTDATAPVHIEWLPSIVDQLILSQDLPVSTQKFSAQDTGW